MKPIYAPRGKAAEYCALAVNIYLNCNHRCSYCYCPAMLHIKPEDFFKQDFQARKGLLPALERQLATGEYRGKLIHLSFIGDPYPAPPVNSMPTRDVIKLIKAAGANVQILTKGGRHAERDFELLDSNDWFGVTISGGEDKEPGAAHPSARLASLYKAKQNGINTWVSLEPVYSERLVYGALNHWHYVDLFRIGKLNHSDEQPVKDLAGFARNCLDMAKYYGRRVELKAELAAYLREGDAK